MNIHTRFFMGVFRHDTGKQGNLQGIKLVGKSVDGNGVKAGVAKKHLLAAFGGGVSFVKGFDVFEKKLLDAGRAERKASATSLALGASSWKNVVFSSKVINSFSTLRKRERPLKPSWVTERLLK